MCLSKLAYSRRDFLSSSKEWRTTHSEEEEEKEEEEEENQNQQTNPHTQQNSTKNRTNPCLHFSFPSTNQNLITYKKERKNEPNDKILFPSPLEPKQPASATNPTTHNTSTSEF